MTYTVSLALEGELATKLSDGGRYLQMDWGFGVRHHAWCLIPNPSGLPPFLRHGRVARQREPATQ
jgi:hypothetical protein